MNKLKQSERKALKLLSNEGSYCISGNYRRSNAEIYVPGLSGLIRVRQTTFERLKRKGVLSFNADIERWVITESGREAANKGYYE